MQPNYEQPAPICGVSMAPNIYEVIVYDIISTQTFYGGITGMSLAEVVKAAFPFMAVLFVFLILVTYVPALSTWLPNMLMGPEIVAR